MTTETQNKTTRGKEMFRRKGTYRDAFKEWSCKQKQSALIVCCSKEEAPPKRL